MLAIRCRAKGSVVSMARDIYDDMGMALAKRLFESLDFDITDYCNAAIDEAFDYCIQEYKKACKREGIDWKKKWEEILDD